MKCGVVFLNKVYALRLILTYTQCEPQSDQYARQVDSFLPGNLQPFQWTSFCHPQIHPSIVLYQLASKMKMALDLGLYVIVWTNYGIWRHHIHSWWVNKRFYHLAGHAVPCMWLYWDQNWPISWQIHTPSVPLKLLTLYIKLYPSNLQSKLWLEPCDPYSARYTLEIIHEDQECVQGPDQMTNPRHSHAFPWKYYVFNWFECIGHQFPCE